MTTMTCRHIPSNALKSAFRKEVGYLQHWWARGGGKTLACLTLLVGLTFADAAFATSGGGNPSLRSGLKGILGIIMAFSFVMGVIAVAYGGWQLRSGDADTGKMSILGGCMMMAGVLVMGGVAVAMGMDIGDLMPDFTALG